MRWLKRAGGGELDGVVAKRLDEPYRAGERAMIKVKALRTADCVVGGFRYATGSRQVGSLLLGLFNDEGKLDHVGFTSGISDAERPALTRRVEALKGGPGFTGDAPGRAEPVVDRTQHRMGAAEDQAGGGGAVRSCQRRPLPPWHQVRPLAAGQAPRPMHGRPAAAGGPPVTPVREPTAANRSATRRVIVRHRRPDLTRGAWLAVGIVLVCGAAAAAAAAFAWHPEIAKVAPPAPASFDRAVVVAGEDMAKLGNCAGCHTSQASRPLAGGRPMETPFGKVFATNITPHPEDGIGAWSREAFGRAMRLGIARNGEHLYPAFPYEHFTHATDHELDALYAWLMTRRPIAGPAPETRLAGVFGFRPLLAGWNLLHLREGPIGDDPDRSPGWNRGRALAEGLAHCGSCHTPRDRWGAEDAARAYDGAMVDGWYAPPLNARSPAVRPWTEERLLTYLRTGLSPAHAAAAGPMGDVTRALAQAPETDVRALAIYFASLMADAPAAKQDTPEPLDRFDVARDKHPEAAALFAGACAVCHEPGAPMMQQGRPPLAWGTPLHADNPHDTVQIILKGLVSPAGPTGPSMPAYADLLDDRQVADLAAYLRSRFTEKPAWPDVGGAVTKARQGDGP